MSRMVHVAVGVVVDVDGNILIAKRSADAHQGGLWEFPGGKVEANENVFTALQRELAEELAIHIIASEPLIQISHDYGDKKVLLDVHKVTAFSGTAVGNEGQPIKWVEPSALNDYEFPAANRPIINAINLPQRLLITGDFKSPAELLLLTEKALKKDIKLVQLRVRSPEAANTYIDALIDLCCAYSARAMINCSADLFNNNFLDKPNLGLHLNAKNLFAVNKRPVTKTILLGASCHDLSELEHAQKIDVDFVCLSPVLATASHLNASGIGWNQFQQWVATAKVPVFALGGMTESDLSNALLAGAQGIAAIREWWR